MDPKHHLFLDERLNGMCVYCGGQPTTRDHVPSRTLLDEPFPENLPVVDACAACNSGMSFDEQYLYCFLECVMCGTTDPAGIQRANVRRTLARSPALMSRIASSQRTDESGDLVWQPETERVRKVLAKLARGHAAYELYPQFEDPTEVVFTPLLAMSGDERSLFEQVISEPLQLWPELGSRAFLRACGAYPQSEQVGLWVIVQPGRYRYSVVEEDSGVVVQMVLSEDGVPFIVEG